MFSKLRSLFVRKEDAPPPLPKVGFQPYAEPAINLEYNQLFCDNLQLFRPAGKLEGMWKTLFAKEPFIDSLKAIAEDNQIETRIRLLAYNMLRNLGVVNTKEVLGVIVEVATEEGDESIGVYKDPSARYINAKSKTFICNNTGNVAGTGEKIQAILKFSQKIISKAEPWTEPRQTPPAAGDFRISFLVTDGFYVGQGKYDQIEKDPAASALISLAGDLMVDLVKMGKVTVKPAEPEKVLVNTAE
jgi:hypothetical protein